MRVTRLLSMNSSCLDDRDSRIHQQKASYRKTHSSVATRRRNSSLMVQERTLMEPPNPNNIGLEVRYLKNLLGLSNEVDSHEQASSVLLTKQSRIRCRSRQLTGRKGNFKPVMTSSPELKLNIDTLSLAKPSTRNQTCYITRKSNTEENFAAPSKLMGVKTAVSTNGKVVTLNLFDPLSRILKPQVPTHSSWLTECQAPPKAFRRNNRRHLGCYTTIMRRTNVHKQLQQDFELKPWAQQDELA